MKKQYFIIITFLFLTEMSFPQVGYGTEVNGDILIPTGKNANDYNIGYGGIAGFYYDLTDNFRMAVVLGYLYSGINQDKVNSDFANGEQQADLKGGMGIIPALISLRLISSGQGMRFYGMIEGGVYAYDTHLSGTYPGGVPTDKSDLNSEPGVVVGAGVLFPLTEKMSLDVNARYHWIEDYEYINYEGTSISNSQGITIGIGVSWYFPLARE
jgi:opacity protein-like surface antigen